MNRFRKVMSVLVGLALASAAFPSGPALAEYELSLHELSKVKKAKPPKRKPVDRRKRKKNVASRQKLAPDATVPQGNDSLADPTPAEVTAPLADNPRIAHEPYSYLVAGKQTVILAVISSAADLKAAYCKILREEQGEDAVVPMIKVDGTQYTYRAILPALAPNSRSLRYRLVAVDLLGREAQSREFVTAVKSTSVIPGWQLEDAPQTPTGSEPVSAKPPENSIAPPPAR